MKYLIKVALSYRLWNMAIWVLAFVTLIGISAVETNSVRAGTSVIEQEQSDTSDPDDGTTTIFLPIVISNQHSNPSDVEEAAIQATSLDIRINASDDDVEERLSNGSVSATSSDLELTHDIDSNSNQVVGLRFKNLAIPKAATIVNAYVEFEADTTNIGNASVTLTGQAADNATAFSTAAYNVSSRAKTAARVTWNLPNWNNINEKHRSPNLATIIQEIVNRGGWSTGNSIVLLIDGSGTRTAESYEGEAAAAPLLHLEFTTTLLTPTSLPTQTPRPTPTVATPTPGATATSTPAVQSNIHFAVVGDFGNDSIAEGNVAAMIARQNPDFIITTGDNRYESVPYDRSVGYYYCGYLAAVQNGPSCAGGNRATNAFFPVLGNHDYGDGGGVDEYLNYFTLPGSGIATTGTSGNERYYDVIRGPVHFFLLDSDAAINNLADRAAQQSWLQSQMTASTAPWQIVVIHHAPYSSSRHGSQNALKWPYLAWGADAVIAGHDHVYERIFQDGLVYFVNGLGGRSIYDFYTPVAGSQVRYNGDYGAMMVDADANGIQFRFLTQTGVEIDRYTVGTPPATGTVDLRLTQSNDDVEEKVATGLIDGGSYDLELVYDGADQIIGLRFNGVQIPQGATIQQAYLEFEADETQSEATNLTIRAEAADHAPAFNFGLFDVSSRPRTNVATSWQPAPWTAVGTKYQTTDVSAVVAEVVNRAGWRSGNSLVFVINGSGHRTAKAVDGEPAAAPRLYVEYRQ